MGKGRLRCLGGFSKVTDRVIGCAELNSVSSIIHILLEPQNTTLFRNGVFADVIS